MPALPRHAAASARHNSQPVRHQLERPCSLKLRHYPKKVVFDARVHALIGCEAMCQKSIVTDGVAGRFKMTAAPKTPKVAFQGERGAFSEEAAVKLLGEEIQLVPRQTFEALYASIGDGYADYILAPIEHSLAGSVHRSYDLLIASGLHIQAEVVIPIVHNFIGVPAGKFERITQVS